MTYSARVIALCAGLFLGACTGDSAVEPPLGGGQRNQPGNCATGALNDAWRNARLSGNRTQPVRCPYTVDLVDQAIVFSADLFGPKETTRSDGFATLWPIRSTLDGWVVVNTQTKPWRDDPNVTTNRMLTFTGNYIAAHYPLGGPGPWSHDSGTVEVPYTNYGPAHAFITLSGSARMTPGYLVTPSRVLVQTAATFRAVLTSTQTRTSIRGASTAPNWPTLTTRFCRQVSRRRAITA